MIFGGNWKTQNKIASGVYINFTSKQAIHQSSKPTTPSEPTTPSKYILLKDYMGVLLKTNDGFYLTVSEI